MQPIKILKSSFEEPSDYKSRLTVKAVVLDGNGSVLLFDNALLGGGVEEGESLEEAIKRECLEEAGILVDSLEPLGIVIQYRDALKKKYEVHGFSARFIEKISEPTTTQESEMKRSTSWLAWSEAEDTLKKNIEEIERVGNQNPTSDKYQAQLFNTMTSLIFLRRVKD